MKRPSEEEETSENNGSDRDNDVEWEKYEEMMEGPRKRYADFLKENENVTAPTPEATQNDDDYEKENVESSTKTSKKSGRPAKPKLDAEIEEYTTDQISAFISKIEEHPVIWDASDDQYHRREVRNKVFAQIECDLSSFLSKARPGKCAAKLWEKLKKKYDAEMKIIEKTPSGAGTSRRAPFFFLKNMQFLNGPRHKRLVKNSHIIGAPEFLMETPKRPISEPPLAKKPRMTKSNDAVIECIREISSSCRESNQQIAEILRGDTSSGQSAVTGWDNLFRVLKSHTEKWSEIDKIKAEGKIINYVCNLLPDSAPQQYQPPPTVPHSPFFQPAADHTLFDLNSPSSFSSF